MRSGIAGAWTKVGGGVGRPGRRAGRRCRESATRCVSGDHQSRCAELRLIDAAAWTGRSGCAALRLRMYRRRVRKVLHGNIIDDGIDVTRGKRAQRTPIAAAADLGV